MVKLPSLSAVSLVFVLIVLTEPITAVPALNTTIKSDVVVCTFPVSGQYGAIPRFIYYASITFAMVARHSVWLVGGALASAMIFSSTAVIHAMVILGQGTNQPVIDLDIFAITPILFSGLLLYAPMITFSSTVRKSEALQIISIWGVWIWVGAFVSVIAWWHFANGPNSTPSSGESNRAYIPKTSEIICVQTNGTIGTMLQSVSQLSEHVAFNCTYDCFSSQNSRIRGQDEILVVPQSDVYNRLLSILNSLALTNLVMGLLGLLTILVHDEAFSHRKEHARRQDRQDQGRVQTPSRMVEEVSAAAGIFTARSLSYLFGAMSMSLIVVSELYLLAGQVPKEEKYYAIEQWAPLSAAVFVVFASLLDRFILQRFRSQSGGVELELVSTGYIPPVDHDEEAQIHPRAATL